MSCRKKLGLPYKRLNKSLKSQGERPRRLAFSLAFAAQNHQKLWCLPSEWPQPQLTGSLQGNKSFREEHVGVLPLPVALYLRLRRCIQRGLPFHFRTSKIPKEFPPSPGHTCDL